MNNTITEMKNTPEGINSIIPEAEGRISKLEDRMVEITAVEQNKEWKEMRRVSETSGKTLNTPTFKFWGPRRWRDREVLEKISEKVIVENFPNMGKEIVTQV